MERGGRRVGKRDEEQYKGAGRGGLRTLSFGARERRKGEAAQGARVGACGERGGGVRLLGGQRGGRGREGAVWRCGTYLFVRAPEGGESKKRE